VRKSRFMRSLPLSSGRLVMVSVSVLCFGLATQTFAGQQSKLSSPAEKKPRAKQVALLSGKRKAAPPPQGERAKSQYGDLSVVSNGVAGVVGTGDIRWIGPNVEIDFPDKASKSVLHVLADDARVSRVGKSEYGLIKLTGNVRYRVVQQAEDGEHILEGTAGNAILQRTKRHMEFTGGVRAKLTDAARFKGPATLRTGSLNVAMEAKPFRYTLDGTAANNDIQFTPLQTKAPKEGAKAPPPSPLGTIHIFGFRSGELRFGQAIHLQGATTTCEFASPDELTSWRLQGEQFDGEFVPDQSDLQRATVKDNVKFHLVQPTSDKKSKKTADGTAPKASYVRSDAGQEMVVPGPFTVSFGDPVHMEEPMVGSGGQSATLYVKKFEDGLTYHIDDLQHTTKFHTQLKPFEEEEPKPVVPPVPKKAP